MGSNEPVEESTAHRRLSDRFGRRRAGLCIPDRANRLPLRRFSVPVLPPGAPSLRVLHLSDIHMVPRQKRKIEWIRSLAALGPDLVINTGDNFGALEAVPAVLRAFEPLLAVPGVFVLGSNDYFAPSLKNPARYLTRAHARPNESIPLPTADLVEAFVSAGWADLSNARARLTIGGPVSYTHL